MCSIFSKGKSVCLDLIVFHEYNNGLNTIPSYFCTRFRYSFALFTHIQKNCFILFAFYSLNHFSNWKKENRRWIYVTAFVIGRVVVCVCARFHKKTKELVSQRAFLLVEMDVFTFSDEGTNTTNEWCVKETLCNGAIQPSRRYVL